jgi:hypothetical protein
VHIDIPSRPELEQLMSVEGVPSVSIYLPTTPITPEADGDRIAFKNLLSAAGTALADQGVDRQDANAMIESLAELEEDEGFWAEQGRTLAAFATPSHTWLFRLPSRLQEAVRVADRLDTKPLLRAVTFPNAGFVLALAQGSCRLIEIGADVPPSEVSVPGLPSDVASAARKASIKDRSPSRRLQGTEGQKIRMRQYARKVDSALRHVLAGRDLPLILAATSPLDEIFRSVNSYPGLLDATIEGNPEALTAVELAERARVVLDAHYAQQVAALRELIGERSQQGRSASELNDVARAATFGAVDTLMVDIDARLAGTIDDETGALRLSEGEGGAQAYSVTDELARRTLAGGGRVLAVRADDMPEPGPAVALLRHPV